jgi:hypothetical protein
MIAKWSVLAIAMLAIAPFVYAVDPATATDPVPAATLLFDGSGGAPTLVTGPGWSCTGPSQDGGEWAVDCTPTVGGIALGAPNYCRNAFGAAGGTPVTIGSAHVNAACAGSDFSADCTVAWLGQGQCVDSLPGSYAFPMHCRASATGVIIGAGTMYAECGNGVA